MKKLINWSAVGLLTTAILEPMAYSMLDMPIPWMRDIIMLIAGVGCFYLLVKYRDDL